MCVSVLTLSDLIIPSSPLIIGLCLFASRIGAAIIEEINDFELFRRISEHDISIITSYRIISPATYIIAGVVGLVFTVATDYMFLALGILIWAYFFGNIVYRSAR